MKRKRIISVLCLSLILMGIPTNTVPVIDNIEKVTGVPLVQKAKATSQYRYYCAVHHWYGNSATHRLTCSSCGGTGSHECGGTVVLDNDDYRYNDSITTSTGNQCTFSSWANHFAYDMKITTTIHNTGGACSNCGQKRYEYKVVTKYCESTDQRNVCRYGINFDGVKDDGHTSGMTWGGTSCKCKRIITCSTCSGTGYLGTCSSAVQITANITFDTNGGSPEPAVTTMDIGTSYNSNGWALPTPTKLGYHFDGWFSDSSFTTEFTSSTVVNSSLLL